jgi:hypothetical protein
VIDCVVPQELADELYQKLVAYYAENPNVEVIVDRRRGQRRGRGSPAGGEQRQTGGPASPARPRGVPIRLA